ncbi:MAG: glycosyltransferase family 4 protein [Spirochaetes bacterium]|nr:glycosyltransferase family 4 protein [Spirochaetota bacterium]
MKIAVEAHALSQEKITGVGNVILHYLNELQRIDTKNEYFIYTMEDLKHLNIGAPRWHHVEFSYPVKRLLVKTRRRWLHLKDETKRHPGVMLSVETMLFRIAKIMLEIPDEIIFTYKLASSLKKNRVDIYIGTSTYYYPYFFLSPVRKVGILYDLVWKLYPGTMEFGNRVRMTLFTLRNMKKIDLLISISENTAKDARDILRLKTRIEAIPLAADPEIFYLAGASSVAAAKKRYGIGKKYILTVCTLEPRKNLKALLAAYQKMPSRRNYQLVLVGMAGWSNAEFFREIETSDVGDNVIFTGYIPSAELAPIYSGAEIFVFPTFYEGFGLPVLEAMQCGCPVITSNTSSIPEVAGDAAIMVDPNDTNALAAGMETLLNSPTTRKNLSTRGIRRAALFSWETSARMLLASLNSLK